MGEQIKNINFGVDTRQKFSIDGDTSKVIELDITDLNIVQRYREAIKTIDEIQEDYNKVSESVAKLKSNIDEESEEVTQALEEFSDNFASLETRMRNLIDSIFDSNICDTILGKTSIFSPVKNGRLKYEQILDVLSNLYSTTIKSEMDKINKANIVKHTKKYGVR